MKRGHVLAISLLLAVAVVAGAFAAYTSAGMSASPETARVTDAQIAAVEAELGRYERQIRAALEQQSPLPPLLEEELPATPDGAVAAVPVLASEDDDDDHDSWPGDDGDEHDDRDEHEEDD